LRQRLLANPDNSQKEHPMKRRDKPRQWSRAIPWASSERTSIVLDSASHNNFRAWRLDTGEPATAWPLDARMSCTDLRGERHPDDVVPNHLGLFVVSHRLRGLCDDFKADNSYAEFLPIRLDYRGQDLGEFYILNLLARVAVLDMDRSSVTRYTSLDLARAPVGGIKNVRDAVLSAGRLSGAPPMFRLAEQKRWVIVRPDMRGEIESRSITGLHFTDLPVS
jgi:hypothetical protein